MDCGAFGFRKYGYFVVGLYHGSRLHLSLEKIRQTPDLCNRSEESLHSLKSAACIIDTSASPDYLIAYSTMQERDAVRVDGKTKSSRDVVLAAVLQRDHGCSLIFGGSETPRRG